MKHLLNSWVPETVDAYEGSTPLALDPSEEKIVTPLKSKHREPCRFFIEPYNPNFQGTLIRNEQNLGTVPLSAATLHNKHRGRLDNGLIHRVTCLSSRNETLGCWTFQTLDERFSNLVLSETTSGKSIWDNQLQPFNMWGRNLVPLIPIGALWKDRGNFFSLTQIYAFLGTNKERKVLWHVIDDHELGELGLSPPEGGHRQGEWFKPITKVAPPRPSFKDINSHQTIQDITETLTATHMDPIHPETLETTIIFEDFTYDI